MRVHRDLIDFWADLSGKSRPSFAIFLLRTDCSQHGVADQKNVGQRRRHEQPIAVFGQPAIARLAEAEHPLDHSDRVLHPRADARLRSILRLIASSMKCFHLHCRFVKSLAFGARARISSPWLL